MKSATQRSSIGVTSSTAKGDSRVDIGSWSEQFESSDEEEKNKIWKLKNSAATFANMVARRPFETTTCIKTVL
ncbi:hypothetical protein DN068_16425 [Taibaiella soli]|uniref:Uncharacterized protein n=1 Tax=Taibaiella soli TaxID=1649169 RepID=A0A2W2A8M2_9BACT|nr:hypothetical protein DN068_16425 [Taibaiella soli]